MLTQSAVPARFFDTTPLDLPASVRVVRGYDPPSIAAIVAAIDARRATRATIDARRSTGAARRSTDAELSLVDRLLPTEPAIVWAPHAASKAIALYRDDPFDALLTTSYPFSAHLVGARVARALSIPWIADLRDPWTLHFTHTKKSAFARAVERALEAQTFRSASAITVTTETLRDAYRARFAEHAARIHAVRNAFDPMSLPPLQRSEGPARLVHFGHVYGGARTLAPVLEALASVARSRDLGPHEVVLENYGRFSSEDLALARRLRVEHLLSLRAPMPYNEGMASLRGAALLLLPAWQSEFGALFLPAKLYDYLLVGAPILAVGENPELATILDETKAGALFAPDDRRSIERMIVDAIDGRRCHAPDERRIQSFEAPSMAARFASILDGVVGSRQR